MRSASPRCPLLLLALSTGCGAEPSEDPKLVDDVSEVTVIDRRSPSTGGSAFSLATSPVYELELYLTAGYTYTFETANTSAGGDPRVHLLRWNWFGWTEVAQNDDGAGFPNARLSYTPTASGTYLVILCAVWNARGGTTNLFFNGWDLGPINFGGAFKRMENLTTNERLLTVPLPQAPANHTFYLMNGTQILSRITSGASGGINFSITSALGLRNVMIGAPASSGMIRLVRNDAARSGHDTDNDGLGDELEAFIGTCSRSTDIAQGYECSRAADMRDTDGDGIRDDHEFLGKVASAPFQLLPRWGADVRHKDMFVEVDARFIDAGESDFLMSAQTARDVALPYSDIETDPFFQLYHAQSLNNPDLLPGIRVHLDTGMDPPPGSPAMDFTTYGNWGGHNTIPATCNADGCTEANTTWQAQMHPNRHGIFHHIFGRPGGGGQCGGISCGVGIASGTVVAHELGHSLRLGHSGPGVEPFDINCKPNFPTLMNYAYSDAGYPAFSDGFGRGVLNNTALQELNAVPDPTTRHGSKYLEDLSEVYDYKVDDVNGHVDWNRDGIFSLGTVRAYANENGAGCEATKFNQIQLAGRTRKSPAIARFGDLTAFLRLDETGFLWLEYTLEDLACPQVADSGCGGPINLWVIGEGWNRALQTFDAHVITHGGSDSLLIVFVDDRSRVWEVRINTSLQASAPVEIPMNSFLHGEISLAGDRNHTYMIHRDLIGTMWLRERDANGVWTAEEQVRDPEGLLILNASSSFPAILQATPNNGGPTLYAAFTEGDNNYLKIRSFNTSTRRFELLPWGDTAFSSIGKPAMAWVPMPIGGALPGRMHLFWLRRSTTAPSVMESKLVVAEHDVVIGGARGGMVFEVAKFGRASFHQNVWYEGYGIDLLFEPGVDSNLRALVAVKEFEADNALRTQLRPKADGIIDYTYGNYNEWEIMSYGTCQVLRDAGASINCPPSIW